MPHPYDPIEVQESNWTAGDPDLIEQENPVIATFLDMHGEPLIEIRERRTVAFGYQKE